MSENKLKIARNNTFRFAGHAVVSDKTFTINSTNKDGTWVHNSLNLGIDCGDCGINYVNCMGGYNPERDNFIYLQKIGEDGKFLSGDNSQMIVNWDERFDLTEDDLKTVNPQNIIKVYLEKTDDNKIVREDFISMYDAIAYIKDHLNDKDPIVVKGHIEYRPSDDGSEWYTSHVLDSITLKTEDSLTPMATADLMVLVGKDCMGQPNLEERNIPLFFNTLTYVRTINGKKYNQTCVVPVRVLLDMNSFDVTTEMGRKQFKYAGENYFSSSKKGYVDELQIRCYYTGGVKKVEVDISDLPQDVREAIEYGIMDKDQVLGSMAVSGNAPKNLVFLTVPTFSKKVEVDGVECSTPGWIHNKAKYKNDELLKFEDLEPIEVATSNTAPVDNSIQIDENDDDQDFDSIMNMFAEMDVKE